MATRARERKEAAEARKEEYETTLRDMVASAASTLEQ